MADPASSLTFGLALAVGSAAAINLGFLLQHRGLARAASGTLGLVRGPLAEPAWLAGQALGIAGFAAQVAAVTLAPLALVQAFAAGGLALSIPLAVLVFHQRVRPTQAFAVLAIAAALGSLPLGLPPVHERLFPVTLGLMLAAVLAGAATAASTRRPGGLAVAAGLCYGGADAAIKAIAVLYGRDGPSALLTLWLPIALIATLVGFLSFQAALRAGDAVAAVTLMSAMAALVALACGLAALDEPFGDGPAVTVGHLLAVGLVLICVRPLAAAQAELVEHAA